MQKWILTLLALHAIPAIANISQRAVSDAEITEQLKFYQKISTLHASFHQTKFIKDLKLELKSEGEMELVRPERVLWKITKPSPTELVLSGNSVSMTSGTGTSKRTESFALDGPMDPAVSKSLVSMVAWLKVDVPLIKESYSIYEVGKHTFKCVPKDEKMGVFQSLTLFLHPKGHLEKLFIEEKSGDHIEITFANPKVTFR